MKIEAKGSGLAMALLVAFLASGCASPAQTDVAAASEARGVGEGVRGTGSNILRRDRSASSDTKLIDKDSIEMRATPAAKPGS